MKCVVTAGPTYEPLDEVRRLTNFSTGKLGSGLANFLAAQGHDVILLLGHYASYRGDQKARQVDIFTTTADLRSRLQALAGQEMGAVFHAAAVSDFTFGKIWERNERGELIGCDERKVPTRKGSLLAELQPTPKTIAELRGWFPHARIVGWKYELDGDRARVIELARQQMANYRTDACVVNGAAYGGGFGFVTEGGHVAHSADAATLYVSLNRFIKA